MSSIERERRRSSANVNVDGYETIDEGTHQIEETFGLERNTEMDVLDNHLLQPDEQQCTVCADDGSMSMTSLLPMSISDSINTHISINKVALYSNCSVTNNSNNCGKSN